MGDESQFGSVCKTMDATTLLSRADDLCFGGMVPRCAVVSGTPVETEVLPVRTRLLGGECAKGDPEGGGGHLGCYRNS